MSESFSVSRFLGIHVCGLAFPHDWVVDSLVPSIYRAACLYMRLS
jgi:hypothetical protein